MRLFLQILIFIGLKLKELLWNTATQVIFVLIIFVLFWCGLSIGIGAIVYNFVDLTAWGTHVYVLTDAHTFSNCLEVYFSLGGAIYSMILAMILLICVGSLPGFLIMHGVKNRLRIKRFFILNWQKSKRITDNIIK